MGAKFIDTFDTTLFITAAYGGGYGLAISLYDGIEKQDIIQDLNKSYKNMGCIKILKC